MKINENEKTDRFGVYPCCWVSGKDACPQNIQEWLYAHFQGYKFAIVFDCTKDEYEEVREVPVYFLDTMLKETVDYIGTEEVKQRLENW